MAGRYNKFSRKLSQTPFVVGGKRMSESSVEELIIESIAPYFQVTKENITFMSSGREDVDVRSLGNGRPFALEINNSTKTRLDPLIACEMEENIAKLGLISVRDLQMITRNEVHFIKVGEESKVKIYRALCILRNKEVTKDTIDKLNIDQPFVIRQWTPVRVLHRRTLMRRERTIHKVKAYAVRGKNNLIVLDINTQAGTYIKELVHGDFNRTEPSISSMIDADVDIISLDVMGIDMEFPKPVKR
jgi:tRNA pseudouridine synthase 10